jgi:hypothetical protein
MDSDKEKESTLNPTAQEAIGDAARANVNAVVEVAKSAVGSFVGVLTGERKKSSTSRRGPRRKKPASKGAASKRGEAKRSTRGRRSAVSNRKATRKSATKRAKAKRPSTRRTSSPAASRRSAQKATTTRATRKSPQAKRSTSKGGSAKPRRRYQLGVAHAERNANWWLEIAQSKRGPLGSGPSWVDEVQGTLINPLRPQAEAPLESITPGDNESSFHPGPQFWASWGRLRDLTRASTTLAAHSVKPRPRCATPSARVA